MVDETVFRSIVFGLQSSEQSLLSTQDLNSGSGVLGQVHQATSVADESSTDKLTDQSSQVGSDGLHSVPEVVGKLGSVFGDGDDLVTERVDVGHIRVGNLGTHRQLCGGLDSGLEVFRQDHLERSGRSVGSEALKISEEHIAR